MAKDKELIIKISEGLVEASQEVRILRNIAWSKQVQEDFFKNGAEKLPVVSYSAYDPKPVLQQIKKLRTLIQEAEGVKDWANRIADAIENSAHMLAARGTKDFHKYSVALYGDPSKYLRNGNMRTIDLARHFDSLYERVKDLDLGAPPEACVLASSLAEQMRGAVNTRFGEHAPEVVMDPELASNALAGREKISIRPTACFTDNDVQQLIEHEAYVHVGTSINGYLQPHLKILAEGHAATTSTQEGLAVFAEFISGTMDLDRLRRLSDRVISINMAIDGADFIEVYRYFLDKTDHPEQSFQNARRVFRGGLPQGGAPFTKDIVYLEGLMDVHNLLRIAVTKGKFEYLDLLFVGKVNIADLPTLKHLHEIGLVSQAQYLPPWVEDKRFLLSFLSYSNFLTKMDASETPAFYERILGND